MWEPKAEKLLQVNKTTVESHVGHSAKARGTHTPSHTAQELVSCDPDVKMHVSMLGEKPEEKETPSVFFDAAVTNSLFFFI